MFRRLAPLFVVATLACGCQTLETYMPVMQGFGVFKLDINQGNFITQDMVDKLKVGQTKQQVRLVLGTPLLVSVFRDYRWDYIYLFARQGRVVEHRDFAVYFTDDKLARWEGDEMPQSVADLNRAAAERSIGRLPSAEDKGFIERFFDIFRSNK